MTKQLRLLVDETMSFGSSDKSIASSPERNEPSPSSNGSSSNGAYKSMFVAVAFINSGCPCSLMIVNCSTSPVLRLVDTSITVLIHNHWATINKGFGTSFEELLLSPPSLRRLAVGLATSIVQLFHRLDNLIATIVQLQIVRQ